MSKRNTSTEYEVALLGALLANSKLFDKVKGYIVPTDFTDKKNQTIFETMINIHDQGFNIEPLPVIKNLKDENLLEKAGGEDYIDLLQTEAGLEANLQKFMEGIVEASKIRQVKLEIAKIQDKLEKNKFNSDEVLEEVEMNIISNTRDSNVSEFKTASQIVDEVLEEMSKKASGEILSGIPSDFHSLDSITGGFHKGDLVILAARPSMGKTALALNFAFNAAKANNVAFFSIEMPSKQIFNRILSATGYVSSNKIQQPKFMSNSDWQKFHLASERARDLKLHVDDTPGIKLSELVWKAKRLKKNVGLDMIIIDYLQLINAGGNGDNRQAEVSTISRTLKKLARELEVPVIALSQLSRKVEQRESKVPMMSDLRESGAIEQDADLIAFVYRDAYYNTDTEAAHSKNSTQKTDIIIGKHRNGATGKVTLAFSPEFGLFTEAPKGSSDE